MKSYTRARTHTWKGFAVFAVTLVMILQGRALQYLADDKNAEFAVIHDKSLVIGELGRFMEIATCCCWRGSYA